MKVCSLFPAAIPQEYSRGVGVMSVWLFISQALATSDPCHGSGCICLSQGMLALEL